MAIFDYYPRAGNPESKNRGYDYSLRISSGRCRYKVPRGALR